MAAWCSLNKSLLKLKLHKMNHIIAEIESHPSRLDKEEIIEREALADNHEFFAGLRLALDSMITFGIKQVPEKTDEDGAGLPWDSFTLALTGFVTRQVTGNTARDMIQAMMKSATKKEWNGWYRRILIKDMRAGFTEGTVNRVCAKNFPQFSIPVFTCQLAHDSANHETKVVGKKLVEVKLDGVRVLTIVYPDGRVNQFSRNGKELVNFPHIKEQFKATCTGITEPVVFDGEVMSSSFQDLMKQIHRKSDVTANDAVLYVFDLIPLDKFEQGKYGKTQEERTANVQAWKDLWSEQTPNVAVLDHELIDLDTAEGQSKYKEINAKAIAGGYEGIMLKDPLGVYECKRSVNWLKLKPFIEVSLEVTDVEEGTGRNIGRLGAFVCSGVDDGKEIVVNVGSGFSDADRTEFWNNRDSITGQIVEVRADAVTQNQDGTYSLRFPRFLHFRGFVTGEKL